MILKGITYPSVKTRKGYNGKADKFYQSKLWRDTRKHFLAVYPLCKRCQELGKVVEATVVDHIFPRSQGGDSLSWSNLQGLCKKCNGIKTALDNPNNGGVG